MMFQVSKCFVTDVCLYVSLMKVIFLFCFLIHDTRYIQSLSLTICVCERPHNQWCVKQTKKEEKLHVYFFIFYFFLYIFVFFLKKQRNTNTQDNFSCISGAYHSMIKLIFKQPYNHISCCLSLSTVYIWVCVTLMIYIDDDEEEMSHYFASSHSLCYSHTHTGVCVTWWHTQKYFIININLY